MFALPLLQALSPTLSCSQPQVGDRIRGCLPFGLDEDRYGTLVHFKSHQGKNRWSGRCFNCGDRYIEKEHPCHGVWQVAMDDGSISQLLPRELALVQQGTTTIAQQAQAHAQTITQANKPDECESAADCARVSDVLDARQVLGNDRNAMMEDIKEQAEEFEYNALDNAMMGSRVCLKDSRMSQQIPPTVRGKATPAAPATTPSHQSGAESSATGGGTAAPASGGKEKGKGKGKSKKGKPKGEHDFGQGRGNTTAIPRSRTLTPPPVPKICLHWKYSQCAHGDMCAYAHHDDRVPIAPKAGGKGKKGKKGKE